MSAPNTALDLDAIETRARTCTTGPWRTYRAEDYKGQDWLVGTVGAVIVTTDGVHASETGGFTSEEDAEFIAHARTDMRDLIDEVRRLRAETALRVLPSRVPPSFVQYLTDNYQSGARIHDPKWHATKLWRAAVYAMGNDDA